MKPPFPYHGGKSRVASKIAELIGNDHSCFVEPFAGSAAVFFSKLPSKVEVLNDADRGVWAFLTALRDHREALTDACLRTPYSREEFAAFRESVDEPDLEIVERARRFWVVITQSFGSVPNSSGWSSPEVRLSERTKIRRLIERFEAASERLLEVHLESDDASRVMRRYDSPQTVQFIDPPYLWSTRSWAPRQKRKQDYRVELQSDDDHSALLNEIVRLESRVILAGRDNDLYRSALLEWRVEELATNNGDMLWLNF